MQSIGWASRDMTPGRPALLQGQVHVRVAQEAMDPLTVTALALEGGAPRTAAILISFDFPFVTPELRDEVRRQVSARIPDVPGEAVLMYPPTARALSGGGYGSMPAVACVGPEGGQELVEASVAELSALFPA